MADRRSLAQAVKALALERCSACGIARAEPLPGLFSCYSHYGPQSRAAYIGRSARERSDIRLWFPKAKSVLLCAFAYWPRPGAAPGLELSSEELRSWPPRYLKRKGPSAPGGYRPARFALARDYHKEAGARLSSILARIAELFPGADGRTFVDSSPVAEKPLGQLAGLGFQGKNTLLINKELGSYFVLGGIALDLDLEADAPQAGGQCGDCNRCAEACPTGALSVNGLDITRCLAYWLSAAPDEMPEEMARQAQGLIAGCDKCQEACPWNDPARACGARRVLPPREL